MRNIGEWEHQFQPNLEHRISAAESSKFLLNPTVTIHNVILLGFQIWKQTDEFGLSNSRDSPVHKMMQNVTSD